MCIDVYIGCLILPFVLNYIDLQDNILLEYCSILRNKHLACTKSIENYRVNYIS